MTFILVMDCLFLMLLILIQLPKKEAGMGTAFGGGATDALFGSGTGNALTNMTKYAATVFFALALTLSIINAHRSQQSRSSVKAALQKEAAVPVNVATPPPKMTNILESVVTPATNASSVVPANAAPAPKAPVTNVPSAPKK